ncbi:SLX4 endonuclease, partial [Amia calva]|nr:SLX4 endonuclease [Amia calva]
MDDSDEEFSGLCAKLLKRVKRRGGEAEKRKDGQSGGEEESRAPAPPRATRGGRRGRPRKGEDRGLRREESETTRRAGFSQAGGALRDPCALEKDPVLPCSGLAAPPAGSAREVPVNGVPSVKEKVLHRMQQFKRVSPERLTHTGQLQPERGAALPPAPAVAPGLEGDEALAVRLQEALQREAWGAVGLECEGLFFCQMCQKDLSAMNAVRRTQHINRCLDESEGSVPPSVHRVPECPICGKEFRSPQSRAAHLKRCAVAMGVPPPLLLEALQRQVAETDAGAARPRPPPGRPKRKGSADPSRAAKRPKRRAEPLDEDTMVALALSRSLVEDERPRAAQQTVGQPGRVWDEPRRPGARKKRRRKGASPAPLPLLLLQDPQNALLRLQERASSLLLRERPQPPPTPGLRPSAPPATDTALGGPSTPLWLLSALWDSSCSLQSFYTPQLTPPIEPWTASLERTSSCLPAAGVPGAPAVGPQREVAQPSLSSAGLQTGAPESARSAVSCGSQGNQTLRDLMDLAEEGLTLTQWGPRLSATQGHSSSPAALPLSGFVPTPERAPSAGTSQGRVALSQLASDLAAMVNNPQLSDVQFQTDSGDVVFAHSFMLYARCPLLVQLVHDEGFSVEEGGMPSTRRVLLGEVPAEAVCALLQYLYTADCAVTGTLAPHVGELASRFGLRQLEELCQGVQGADGAPAESWQEAQEQDMEGKCEDGDHNFQELLRSMWIEEEEEREDEGQGAGEEGFKEYEGQLPEVPGAGDTDPDNERVDEDELDEIYEFAATQRKLVAGTQGESTQEEEEEEEEEEDVGGLESEVEEDQRRKREEVVWPGKRLFSPPADPPGDGDSGGACGSTEKGIPANLPVPVDREKDGTSLDTRLHCDPSLDKSYDRIFSESWGVYVEPSQQDIRTTEEVQDGPGVEVCGPARGGALQPDHNSKPLVIDLSISPPLSSAHSSPPRSVCSPASSLASHRKSPGTRNAAPVGFGNSPTSRFFFSRNPGSGQKRTGGLGEEPGQRAIGTPKKLFFASRERSTPEKKPPHLATPRTPPASKPEDVIVLLDSDEEMELKQRSTASQAIENERKASPGGPPPQDNASASGLALLEPVEPKTDEDSPGTLIKTEDRSQQSPDIFSPGADLPGERSLEAGRFTLRLSSQSELGQDDSMETSWLVPGTPTLPVMARSISTQTHSSMNAPVIRRTNLFPAESSLAQSSSSARSESSLIAVALGRNSSVSKSTTTTLRHGGPQRSHTTAEAEARVPVVSSSSGSGHQVSPVKRSSPECSPHRLKDGGRLALVTNSQDLSSPEPIAPSSQLPIEDSVLQRSSSNLAAEASLGPADSPRSPKSTNPVNSTVPSLESSAAVGLRSPGSRGSADFQDRVRDCNLSSISCQSPRGGEFRSTKQNHEQETPLRPEHSFCPSDEPPMPFDDTGWGFPEPLHSSPLGSNGPATPPETGEEDALTPPQTSPASPRPSCLPAPRDERSPEAHPSFLDSKLWADWEEEEVVLPLSQRVSAAAPTQRVKELRTPVATQKTSLGPLVPITPMPTYSDMDTPELKTRLNRFGVRALPKRQMILKLKEIHQFTHQVISSESEDEGPSPPRPSAPSHRRPPAPPQVSMAPASSAVAGGAFKEPAGAAVRGPGISPVKAGDSEDPELLTASQCSTASSTAASEDSFSSQRSNPEDVELSGDEDEEDGVTASQAATREEDKLLAVRRFITSDPELHRCVLLYQPLVLSQLQARLRQAGIRLGATKLLDFLDSQCITFTTAKPGQPRGQRRRRQRGGKTGSQRARGKDGD